MHVLNCYIVTHPHGDVDILRRHNFTLCLPVFVYKENVSNYISFNDLDCLTQIRCFRFVNVSDMGDVFLANYIPLGRYIDKVWACSINFK